MISNKAVPALGLAAYSHNTKGKSDWEGGGKMKIQILGLKAHLIGFSFALVLSLGKPAVYL